MHNIHICNYIFLILQKLILLKLFIIILVSEIQQTQLRSLLQRQLDNISTDVSTIHEFIVIRRPAPGESMETVPSTVQPTPQPMETDEIEEPPRPMNIDTEETISSTFNRNIETVVLPTVSSEDEALPSVVVGSEPWHFNIANPSWIPVITRDLNRQRRQSPQPPFSDAYLSGMTSKRRKLITDRKTPVDIPNMLADGIRCAITASGVPPTNTSVADIANSIVSDTTLQTSYKEALKSTVQDRLKNDADFDADRFPNSSKYFNSKK